MQTTKDDNQTVNKYIKGIAITNKKTASDYKDRLNVFSTFIKKNYNLSLDELILTLTAVSYGPRIDVSDLLSEYVAYIHVERNVSPHTLKMYVSTVRGYLETFDVDISPRKFHYKVRMPRVIITDKEALHKSDIQTILNACSNIKLKTYVLFLAATGCRPEEALSVRLCDFNFTKDPATVFIRGEFTKMKRDRNVMITKELAQQLHQWIEYKYRTRTVTWTDRSTGKTHVEKRTPKVNNEYLLFSTKYRVDATVDGLYTNMLLKFEKTLDRMGGKYAELEHTKKRHKFTLHSFRRWVKTTISDLGHSEYSEYFIGHKVSTYYRVSETEKIKLFKKIEPNLTFLDISGLERKGADLDSRLDAQTAELDELRGFRKRMDEFSLRMIKKFKDIGVDITR